MKKLLFTLIAGLACNLAMAQTDSVKTAVSVKPVATKFKPVPAKKAVNARKNVRLLHLQLKQFGDSVTIMKRDMDALIEATKNDLDSMSEMGETESLRLQRAMDRLSKMMTTLSNLLKRASDTQKGITQNIK